jgi:hypothetical protein
MSPNLLRRNPDAVAQVPCRCRVSAVNLLHRISDAAAQVQWLYWAGALSCFTDDMTLPRRLFAFAGLVNCRSILDAPVLLNICPDAAVQLNRHCNVGDLSTAAHLGRADAQMC